MTDDAIQLHGECPGCGIVIGVWTTCPECGWYDDDRWEEAIVDELPPDMAALVEGFRP